MTLLLGCIEVNNILIKVKTRKVVLITVILTSLEIGYYNKLMLF